MIFPFFFFYLTGLLLWYIVPFVNQKRPNCSIIFLFPRFYYKKNFTENESGNRREFLINLLKAGGELGVAMVAETSFPLCANAYEKFIGEQTPLKKWGRNSGKPHSIRTRIQPLLRKDGLYAWIGLRFFLI
ncbi:MAG: hypothetical protein C4527_07355 [Candidatus Omnitrophota bacterium]|nr:MAG: hypothetical protein C4527_07355 [Candidatus Omnitrophota bacterium]